MIKTMGKKNYSTRLQKGGALIEDMRIIVRNWSEEISKSTQIKQFLQENILGKITKTRSADALRRVYSHRFLDGNPLDAWKIVRPLEDKEVDIEIVRPIYYWITARSDPLMYDFVIHEIFPRSKSHDLNIQVKETAFWIKERVSSQNISWTETVTLKVARGLLAALRDFAILEGGTKKRIAPVYLPNESFAYIAFALNTLGISGQRLVNHEDWKLFLFSPPVVERMFLEAHQNGVLRYEAAGNLYRIEFMATNYREMADVITKR
jgi:hypothetical protein